MNADRISSTAYPGIKKVGWIDNASISPELAELISLGHIPQINSAEISWVPVSGIPSVSQSNSKTDANDEQKTVISFKTVDLFQFPPNISWIAVDFMDAASIIPAIGDISGSVEVRKDSSRPGADPACFSYEVTIPSRQFTVRLVK